MYLVKNELDYFEEKIAKIFDTDFSVKKGQIWIRIRGTNIPDPNLTWPKG
jgi:hypothetical protein